MAALDQDDLKMLLRLSKAGKTLEQICEALEVEAETVCAALAQKLGITTKTMKRVFTLKKQGDSLEEIGELCSVAIALLLEVFPESSLPADLRKQILTLARQGLSSEDISHSTGIAEAEVITVVNSIKLQSKGTATVSTVLEQGRLDSRMIVGSLEETKSAQRATDAKQGTKTYTLGSPDEGVSLTSKASEPAPVYHRTPEEAKQPQRPQPTQTKPQHSPTFFYSCPRDTNQLHRVNLLTGEQSEHEVPHYQFKYGCRWSELPGGSLLITGGEFSRDVVRVDVGTFAVSPQPPMHTARQSHAAVYHSQYVYVLGFRECERYVCAESRWEVLAALPVGGLGMSAVELHNSLYALGGCQGFDDYLDTVQQLSLVSLTWQLMQLKLPQADWYFPCFKKDTEVYLVINKTLYSFTPLEVKPIKTLPEDIKCYSSYYSRGTLYYEGGSIGLTRL
jgi:hypothetical protein